MKVVIAATARFHLFDAAEQLKKRGMLGRMVTGILPSRIRKTTLDPEDFAHAAFWQSLFFVGFAKLPDGPLLRAIERRAHAEVDNEACYHIGDSQAIIVMGNTGLKAGSQMQRKGGTYFVDRPVIHLRTQDEVLAAAYDHAQVPYLPMEERKLLDAEAEYAQADGILVPSKVVAQSMIDRGIPASKLFILNQAADLSLFQPEGEAPDDMFTLGFAGNVTIQKGIHVLTEAIEQLKGHRIRLWIAGMVQPEAHKFIKRLEAVCELEMLNKISSDALRKRMSQSHAFVLPSVQDGFGLVTPQAMGCGTAVIVSDRAGSSEIVQHGRNGLVFKSGDSSDLAAQIERLIQNREEAYEMGAVARQALQHIGGWEEYGDKIEAILRSYESGSPEKLSFASEMRLAS